MKPVSDMTVDKPKKKISSLAARFLVGIPVGALTVCLLAFGDRSLAVLAVFSTWLALQEFWTITGVRHPEMKFPLARLGDIASVILVISTWLYPTGSFVVIIAIMIPCLFIYQLVLRAYGAKEFLREVAVVTLGVIYIGGFLSFIFKLRNLQMVLVDTGAITFSRGFFHIDGMIHLTLFVVLASWGCDTAALFTGKYFGSTKLAPGISPNKTIIGLVGGMIGSVTAVLVYSWLIGLTGQIQIYQLVAFGALAAAFSQLGDLTVSALKREAHTKDTGKILGAHGGVLDRLDGFIFAAPAAYLFFLMVVR